MKFYEQTLKLVQVTVQHISTQRKCL